MTSVKCVSCVFMCVCVCVCVCVCTSSGRCVKGVWGCSPKYLFKEIESIFPWQK